MIEGYTEVGGRGVGHRFVVNNDVLQCVSCSRHIPQHIVATLRISFELGPFGSFCFPACCQRGSSLHFQLGS
jgi:hypothetical protein